MGALVTGVIAIWSGAIVDIPAGFVLCDGNNGTPDLTDKFVPGAGGGYAPGATGGNSTHTHNGTTNGHNHTIPGGVTIDAGATYSDTLSTETDTFTSDAASSLPPYYALAYIMKT